MTSKARAKLWFSLAELAEMNLPGLSPARNRVVEKATKDRWADRFCTDGAPAARPRSGRGGGFEYHVSVLPPSARLEMVKSGLLDASYAAANDDLDGFKAVAMPAPAAPPPAVSRADWAWFDAQPTRTKDDAKRRLIAVQQVELITATGFSRDAAVTQVAAMITISKSALWEWLGLVKGVPVADRLPALAPRRRGGGVKADIHPEVLNAFKSYYLTPTARTYQGAYYYTRRWAEAQGLPMPHIKTIQRRLEAEVPREVIILKRQGVKALNETVPSQTRSVEGMHAMELINIDGHKFDVFVRTPDGSAVIRPMLIAMQDVYSRKMLAWRLCGEESIFHTRLCFADLFEKWGLPEEVLCDNGRAFASKYLTSGTKTRFRGVVKETDPWGMLPQLGIKNYFATPEHGQAKPIERGFGGLVKFIAHHPMCEGAYTGNSPVNKPHNYGSKVLEWADFSTLVDQQIAEFNNFGERRTEMAKGELSLDQLFTLSYERSAIRKATRQQINMALLEAKLHRCDRKTGEIRMLGNRYHHEALYPLAGQEVSLRFDPDNLHSPVQVYSTKGRYICEAAVIEAVGFRDAEAAKQIAKKRADMRKLARQLTDAEGLLAASELAAMQPRPEVEEAPKPRPGATRLVRARGNSAAALKIIAEGTPNKDCAPPISLFTAAVERMEAEKAVPKFTIFDGGLMSPQPEPERPK